MNVWKYGFTAFVVVAVAVGTFFRLYHLDRKVVWSDEIFTRLRIAGLTEADVVGRAATFRDVGALRAYVGGAPGSPPKPPFATVGSLVAEDPQHAPLYYVVARAWLGVTGDTLRTERLLSAVIGILEIPCAYWLAMELFGLASVARIFAALVAVSPFFVLYSQENREYALWGVAVSLLCASVLRAVRVGTPVAWSWVALASTIALYTDPLSLGVIGGIAVFAIVAYRGSRRILLAVAGALGAGVAAYAPWLVVIAAGRGQIARDMAWIVERKDPVAFTIQTFFGEWHLAIFDFNIVTRSALGLSASCAVLLAIVVAFVVLARDRVGHPATFVFAIVAGSVLPLLVADVAISGHRSANPRYLVPFFLFEELAVAYALARGIARDRRWSLAFGAAVVAGVVSCAASSTSETWWTKYNERSIAVARAINRTSRPILVSDNYVHLVLSIAPYLKPGTRIAIVPQCYLCGGHASVAAADRLAARLSADDDAFLLGPSDILLRRVRTHSDARPARIRCIDVVGNCASDLRLF